MYQVTDIDQPIVNESQLYKFSPYERSQVHSIQADFENQIDLILFINSSGSEDLIFVGELELRFNYFFIREDDPTAVPIEKKNNVRRFKIQAPLVSPFDISFDYQILNPLVRHMNYESNNMKKLFLVDELALVVLNVENKGQRLKLLAAGFNPAQDFYTFKTVKQTAIEGRLSPDSDLVLEEREQAKLQLFLKPIHEAADFTVGNVEIKWVRNDHENMLSNPIRRPNLPRRPQRGENTPRQVQV